MRCHLGVFFVIAAANAAFGQTNNFSFAVSEVTNAPAPNGSYNDGTFIHGASKFTFDMITSLVDPNDDWTGCGVLAKTFNGPQWFYSSTNFPTAPGTSGTSRFSTFVSNPVSQFDNARFIQPAYLLAQPFVGTAPGPVHSGAELNVAWLENPTGSTSLDTNAATLRLTLDTANTVFNHVRIGPLWLNIGTPIPTPGVGETLVASVLLATNAAHNPYTPANCQFYVYGSTVPEPAAGMAILFSLLFLRTNGRRRH